MRRTYIPEGIILTVLAADTSGIQGQWAAHLQLPFGVLAAMIWLIVPFIFIAVSIPFVCKKLGWWQHLVHIVAIGCIAFPVVVFCLQSRPIDLRKYPSREVATQLRTRFNERIIIVSSRGYVNAYVPRSFDKNEVAKMIFSLDPSLNPRITEPGASLPDTKPADKYPAKVQPLIPTSQEGTR